MSWMGKLYDTYERAMELNLPQEEKPIPEGHVVQNAHINIVLDSEGNFKRASVIGKVPVVLPATEKSAGRTSGEAPHPLADKLQYVAGDYAELGGKKPSYFDGYLEQLKNWRDFLKDHKDIAFSKVNAVYSYVGKGCVIDDLVKESVVWLDSKGKLACSTDQLSDEDQKKASLLRFLPKEKGEFEQGSALVCWTVEISHDLQSNTWKDLEIQRAWRDYLLSQETIKGLCYVTGKDVAIALNHPARLRNSGDKAKLISSNDKDGFTFRGKFFDSKKTIEKEGYQAANVGSSVSQRAHSALRWLIDRQGFKNGDQIVIAWAISGKKVPPPMESLPEFDFDDLGEGACETSDVDIRDMSPDLSSDLGQGFARKLTLYMNGYRSSLSPDESVVIMSIDSATPGRMGITYYRECFAHEYVDRVAQWHSDFAWLQRKGDGGTGRGKYEDWEEFAPAPPLIVGCSYDESLKGNTKFKGFTYERILPAIVESRNIPYDIVASSVRKACAPRRASKKGGADYKEWEKTLGVACALYRGFFRRHENTDKRRYYPVGLDVENRSRSYLFGRLLAIADGIESFALIKSNETRPTSAERLMQRFASHPCSTWRTIELSLQPYMQRLLRSGHGGFITNRKRDLDSVMELFDGADFSSDAPLEGEFLLGFHCQRLELLRKKDKSATDNSEGGNK
ncbi:CRISPR-associated protein, Csd1 family [Dethiosulfovibrio peptidovorans DSM 11002]|uniref:CRISPR-associated protein, Csd1 family n=1 Tax=Dethiosulfovibrio peptidovorans DSM 11002 TaxID=469381 RepID=D2Z6K1_9BACT|nr:type I-C CRISPR-associated protein Cas8c/Csd1 [Dethiosulfovibrio peptidovorans]EFC91098.1 CRISPR-associated protein, Csd1 family [Dethiosulfovibrio peptidovorans DSM 11002]